MDIENNTNNQTIISTSVIYSHPNTNIKLYSSSSTTSTISSSSKIVLQNDITTTLLPSSSASNEISSSFDTPRNSYTYISSNTVASLTSQQSNFVSNLNVVSSTIASEINLSTISNIQSIHPNFPQQGYSSSSKTTGKYSSRKSTSYSPLVSVITSKNSPDLETYSSSLIPTTSSSPTFSTYSQDLLTSISNFSPIETAISSFITYYDTTSKVQLQSSFSSLLENFLRSPSEVSKTSQSTSISKNKSTTTNASLKSFLTYTPSFTQNSETSQYSSYSSQTIQPMPTNKTLTKSSKSTTTKCSLSKTSTLKSIKKTSSFLSSSSISSYTTTDSKFTSTISFSSTSSSSVSSFQNIIVYTQEYYFTGKTTSFSTGIPITLTLSPSGTESTYSLSTTSVITAPMEVYNKWINGGGLDSTDAENNGNTDNSTGTNDGTIAGSVIGAVGGVILCAIIIWFVMFKRKKYCKNWNNKLCLNKSRKSEGITDHSVSSSQSFIHPKGYRVDYNSTNNIASDPFKHEFEFDNRYNSNKIPPVPAPRKDKTSNNKEFNNMETPAVHLTPSNNDGDNYHLRFSYVSSDTDSSFNSSAVGSYSIISSSPDKYRTMGNNKQGFLREVL